MIYWIFLLVTTLILPVIMIVFGTMFYRRAPKTINKNYGYRTKNSMKNIQTWTFAHKFIGKKWLIFGGIMSTVSPMTMIFLYSYPVQTLSYGTIIIITFQLLIMFFSIYITERALKKRFKE